VAIEASRRRYRPIKNEVAQKRRAVYKGDLKQCKKCKEWKPTTEYNTHPYHWDNLTHKCKKCINKETRRRYKKNRDENLKKGREWYRQNREKKLAQNAQWRRDNPESSHAIWHRYKSRKINSGGDFTSEQWEQVKGYYCPTGRCLCCNKKRKLTIDHVIPLSRGGGNYISNIQPLCKSCNSTKGGYRKTDYRPDKGEFAKSLMREE